MPEGPGMRKSLANGLLIGVSVVVLGLVLGAVTPYYNLLVAGSADLFVSGVADVSTDGNLVLVARDVAGGSEPPLIATTNGYLFQLSFLVLIGSAFAGWKLRVRRWRILALVTLMAIFASHVVGVWIDSLAFGDSDIWVQVSGMVTFAWTVLPAAPLVAAIIVQWSRVDKGRQEHAGILAKDCPSGPSSMV